MGDIGLHPSSLVILLLSHAGYWLAGTDVTVSVGWAVPDQMPQAKLVWSISIGPVPLQSGSVTMNPAAATTDFKVKCPIVRVRTELHLTYRLTSLDGKQELATGQTPIHAFPADLMDGWSRQLAAQNIVVVDSADGLPALLTQAKVAFKRVDHPLNLQWERPNLVLVGADRLDDSPMTQSVLIEHARAGAGVLILRQTHVGRLNGFWMVHRALPARIQWLKDHPLLQGLDSEDLDSLLSDLPRDELAIRLPADRPVVPIARWLDDGGDNSVKTPSDALLTSEPVGSGHIVMCQLNLSRSKPEDWTTDPRTMMLVGNALDYLSAPTLPAGSVDHGEYRLMSQAQSQRVLTSAGDDR